MAFNGQIICDGFSDGVHESPKGRTTSLANLGQVCYFTHPPLPENDNQIVYAKEWPYKLTWTEAPSFNSPFGGDYNGEWDYMPLYSAEEIDGKTMFTIASEEGPYYHVPMGNAFPHQFQLPYTIANRAANKNFYSTHAVNTQLTTGNIYEVMVRVWQVGGGFRLHNDTSADPPVWRWGLQVKFEIYVAVYSDNGEVVPYWSRYDTFAQARTAFNSWDYSTMSYNYQTSGFSEFYRYDKHSLFTAEARKGYGTKIEFEVADPDFAEDHLGMSKAVETSEQLRNPGMIIVEI